MIASQIQSMSISFVTVQLVFAFTNRIINIDFFITYPSSGSS